MYLKIEAQPVKIVCDGGEQEDQPEERGSLDSNTLECNGCLEELALNFHHHFSISLQSILNWDRRTDLNY